jgi:hypothetical protein
MSFRSRAFTASKTIEGPLLLLRGAKRAVQTTAAH